MVAVFGPRRPRIVPPMTREPFLSAFGLEVAGVEAERSVLGRLVAGLGELDVAAGGAGRGARGVGEQALLGGQRRRSTGAAGAGAAGLAAAGGALACRQRPCSTRRGRAELVLGRGGGLAAARRAVLRRRVGARDLAEVGVGVGVAVDVLEHHEVAQALGLAELDDAAVVDRDHRAPWRGRRSRCRGGRRRAPRPSRRCPGATLLPFLSSWPA